MNVLRHPGIWIASLIVLLWGVSLFALLSWNFSGRPWLVVPAILLQMHLYTGLFITAHDAMHRTVSPDLRINNAIGTICTALYAAFSFRQLLAKHHDHHRHVHSEQDPDYHDGNFFSWYFRFMLRYLTLKQLLIMAILFNILKIWFSEISLLLFWVIPSLLSTLQLFYFGTWQPHHGEHNNHHHSRSQRKNHVVAFVSCYFFGYHYEHHDSPATPWWKLWAKKQ
jgi:beta-carotene/zeaxanthin 4-ketolase